MRLAFEAEELDCVNRKDLGRLAPRERGRTQERTRAHADGPGRIGVSACMPTPGARDTAMLATAEWLNRLDYDGLSFSVSCAKVMADSSS